jgi:hypothetical protein
VFDFTKKHNNKLKNYTDIIKNIKKGDTYTQFNTFETLLNLTNNKITKSFMPIIDGTGNVFNPKIMITNVDNTGEFVGIDKNKHYSSIFANLRHAYVIDITIEKNKIENYINYCSVTTRNDLIFTCYIPDYLMAEYTENSEVRIIKQYPVLKKQEVNLSVLINEIYNMSTMNNKQDIKEIINTFIGKMIMTTEYQKEVYTRYENKLWTNQDDMDLYLSS